MALSNAQVLKQLTSEVLAIEAPNEAVLVELYVQAKDDPRSTAKGALGFGIGVEIGLLLPVVMGFLGSLLAETAKDTVKGVASTFLIGKLRMLLASREGDTTAARKAMIETTAEELIKAGLDAPKAASTADSIVKVVLANKQLFARHG